MPENQARSLIVQAPSYEYRSSGKLCVVCGAIIGNVPGDDQVHERWHQAIAALLS